MGCKIVLGRAECGKKRVWIKKGKKWSVLVVCVGSVSWE